MRSIADERGSKYADHGDHGSAALLLRPGPWPIPGDLVLFERTAAVVEPTGGRAPACPAAA
jgi:hypothetical protein